ncbi:predicted protein [Chaetoceros tenuissimus]|uniref:ShKT domain-containing protein n=1 Tax=Chaetoceros tenuissimus TaxID=426638 RepID=A0AAD3HAS9_9STRA|nr:predicted protein [Chaetoceros tenuissimus]
MIISKKITTLALLFLSSQDLLTSAQEETECYNKRARFKVNGVKYSCQEVQNNQALCYQHKKFKNKCPLVCGSCECKDDVNKFNSVIKGTLTCKRVAKRPEKRCSDTDARWRCPLSCGMCGYASMTIAPTVSPQQVCIVDAELSFPSLDELAVGSHSASLSTSKSGSSEVCNAGITSWGCLHQGDAAILKTSDGSGNVRSSESIQIINGGNGIFEFKVQHVDSDGTPPPATLSIASNSKTIAAFTHDASDEKDLKIKTSCDAFCNCVVERIDTCSLQAEFRYEDVSDNGYHRDDVSATMANQFEVCDQSTLGETSWGCTHLGNAAVWNPQNTDYYNYNHGETVDVTNAYGSTIYLDVVHHFSDLEKYYDRDHRIQGALFVSVNGQTLGEYSHPKNGQIDTHLNDGSINPDYKGKFRVTVTCDDSCVCDVSKYNIV